MQKYSHLSQPRRSSAHDAHKAMVQRFQLRRISTGTVSIFQHDGSSSTRRRSSLIISSLNFIKQIPVTRRPFWQRALKKLRHWALDFVERL